LGRKNLGMFYAGIFDKGDGVESKGIAPREQKERKPALVCISGDENGKGKIGSPSEGKKERGFFVCLSVG